MDIKARLKVYIQLLRIRQWVKNFFIFFPLLFSGQLFNTAALVNSLLTVIGFCFISSGVYILNDFLDSKKDRLHPKKSARPLAMMRVSILAVIVFVLFNITLGLWICSQADPVVVAAGGTFVVIHLIYNFLVKRIVILDVIFIAIGFQLRIWAGSLAIGVLPSVWLQMCVFILALFLGFTKRRHEITILKTQAGEHREVLSHYTTYLLDQIIIICSTLAITFYGLYVISSDIVARTGNHIMVYSVSFVIYGIFRYLYLVHVKKLGDDPGEILFLDKSLLISILLWIVFVAVILYNPM